LACELWAIHGDTGEAWTVLIREWRSLSDTGQANILELRDEYEHIWLDVLTEAHDAGLVKQDPFIVRRLLMGSMMWTASWFRPQRGLSLDDLTEEVLQLVTAGQA